MKPLRPLFLVTAGTVLLTMALVATVWFVMPEYRNLSTMSWVVIAGVAGGLAFLAPLAAIQAIRNRYPNWGRRYYFRIGWYTSMSMGFAMGYLAACFRHTDHKGSDPLFLTAIAVVFFGAVIKTSLGYMKKDHDDKKA